MRKPECRFWRVMNPTQTETIDSRRCGAFFKKRRSEAILVETKAVELCSISLVYTNCTGGMRKPECRFWRVMNPTQTETIDSRRCGAFFKKKA